MSKTPENWIKFFSLGSMSSFKKGDFLLETGNICSDLFLVVEGMVRVYYLKDGIEVTDWFGTAGSAITSLKSFHNEEASGQSIQAITDVSVIQISKSHVESVISQNAGFNLAYIEIISSHLSRLEQRINALQTYTPQERYSLLMEKDPLVVQNAQPSHIASYLGISPEIFSSIQSP